jgi:hypothetical protein
MNQPITMEQLQNLVQKAVAASEPWLTQNGIVAASGAVAGSTPVDGPPVSWTKTGERHGVEYTWPNGTSHFDPFEIYRSGNLELAVGFDRDGNGNPTAQILKDGVPFASFQPAADFDQTKELVGIIRGRGGGRKMFTINDPLPPQYAQMTIARLSDRIPGHRFRNAACIVIKRDDVMAMLQHGKAQVELRGL